MQIHVVLRGESLYNISKAYGISYEEVAAANEIPDPSRLAVGQALVIPIEGSFHLVQPGQSLYVISQLYGVSVQELARINGISPTSTLQIGQRLTIPAKPKRMIDSLLYVEPRTPVTDYNDRRSTKSSGFLNLLAIFSYQVNRDGSLTAPATGDILNIAKNADVGNFLCLTNLENYTFSPDLAHAILSDEAAQNQLIRQFNSNCE